MDADLDEAKGANAKGDDVRLGDSSGATARRQMSVGWLSDLLTTFAAFTMFLGPGLTAAFYIVTVGYYENKFKTKLFFIVMLLATYGPFPVVAAFQAAFDAHFDRVFTTQVTYATRIFSGLMCIQFLVVVWMFVPATEGAVVCIGFALGASCCVVQASGHQMISAIDPTKLVFSELGGQIGSVVPIVMISLLDFKPSATPPEFRRFIATPVFVSFFAMVVLMVLHLRGFFHKAYLGLARDLDEDDLPEAAEEAERVRQTSHQAAVTRLLDEPIEFSHRALSRQATPEAEPSSPVVRTFSTTRRSVPGWVYRWQAWKGFTTLLMAFMVSLAGFYGDPAYTQFLASIKLASDFVGRASSLPLVRSSYFASGPWHRFLAATVVARVLMVAVMVAQLGADVVPKPVFIALWCSFSMLDRMVATFADVTCGAFVEVRDRRFVSRLTFLFGFGGLILGLCVSALVAVPMERHMDKMGKVLLDMGSPPAGSDLGLPSVRPAFRAAARLHASLQPR